MQFTGGFPLCLSIFWTSGTGELWCLALNTLFLSFILFHRDVPAITTYIGVNLDLGQASLRPSTPGHTLPRCDGHLKLVEGTGLLWPQVEPGRREENSKPTKESIVCQCLSRERLQAAPCGTDGRMGLPLLPGEDRRLVGGGILRLGRTEFRRRRKERGQHIAWGYWDNLRVDRTMQGGDILLGMRIATA